MSKIDLIKRLAKEEGAYQDIYVGEELINKGWRNCEDRWELIEPSIDGSHSVLDIGSHYGYFSMKCAEKGASVLSIEPDNRRNEIQRLAIEENKSSVILGKKKIRVKELFDWYRACGFVDVVLCLSVIHYIENPEIFIWLLSQITQTLIIEFPNNEETNVASRDNVKVFTDEFIQKVLNGSFDSVQEIGQVRGAVGGERRLFLCHNYKIIREKCLSHIYSKATKKRSVVYRKGWKVNNKRIEKRGFNLADLHYFEVPLHYEWLAEASGIYKELIERFDGNVTDIHPRNIIVNSKGAFVIDWSEKSDVIYGMKIDDYRNKIKQLSKGEIRRHLERLYKELGK